MGDIPDIVIIKYATVKSLGSKYSNDIQDFTYSIMEEGDKLGSIKLFRRDNLSFLAFL